MTLAKETIIHQLRELYPVYSYQAYMQMFILLTQTDLYFQNLPQNCYKGAHYASINKKYTHHMLKIMPA